MSAEHGWFAFEETHETGAAATVDMSRISNSAWMTLKALHRGEFRVGRDDWGVLITGSDFKTSGSGLFEQRHLGRIGLRRWQNYRSSFDFMSVGVEGSGIHWISSANPMHRHSAVPDPRRSRRRALHEHPADLDFGGNATEAKGEFASLYGGIQLILRMDTMDRIPWLNRIELRAGGSGGTTLGHDGGVMYQARADIQFYFFENSCPPLRIPAPGSEHLGRRHASPSLQGLFVGLTSSS